MPSRLLSLFKRTPNDDRPNRIALPPAPPPAQGKEVPVLSEWVDTPEWAAIEADARIEVLMDFWLAGGLGEETMLHFKAGLKREISLALIEERAATIQIIEEILERDPLADVLITAIEDDRE